MNHLLEPSRLAYGAPQFDKIQTADYLSAFEEAITRAKRDIDKIVENPAEPDFENTIEALEESGSDLGRISAIFFNLNEACTSPEMHEIAEKVSPMLNEYSLYVSLNRALFARVRSVYERRGRLGLDPVQMRLCEQTYRSFARGGANLEGRDRERYGAVKQELQLTSLRFDKNALDATNAYTLHITDEADLEGMPAYVVDAAAQEAVSHGCNGWLFTLQAPSYRAFMAYSTNRAQREAMWRAYNTRALGGEQDNSGNIRKIVSLREEGARLLGYRSFSCFALEERMAKNPETVNAFLADQMARCRPYAARERKELKEYAAAHGFEGKVKAWDFNYWSRRLKEERYSFTAEQLKPYFELGAVRRAVFSLATTLYGLTFERREDIPGYHPDVEVYQVSDGERFMGLLYMDFFPRESKRQGAWMTNFREQYISGGLEYRPLVSLVTNFTKPVGDTPSLLTFDEVTTLLHEFGHCLHSLLSEGRYASLTGTNVTRDFVELPSQLMENWAYEPQWLNTFARHYQTGEMIPAEFIEKIVAARNYHAGCAFVRQLQFGLLDMAWHSGEPLPDCTVPEFERRVCKPDSKSDEAPSTAMSTTFTHIFAGGYAAGYYSYKWAEVLAADAFEYFKQEGIFNRELAARFRKRLLSRGDSEDADVLYRNWRGRDAKSDALLKSNGLSD